MQTASQVRIRDLRSDRDHDGNQALRLEAQHLANGLTSPFKTIDCSFYYDDAGSRLFEGLCEQPEYYLARIERQIIEQFAAQMVAVGGPCDIVELGSGNARKTKLLIEAFASAGHLPVFIPIDINCDVIERSAVFLTSYFPSLTIHGLAGTYAQGLGHLPESRLRRLFLLLGSTTGNMTDAEIGNLLKLMRRGARPGDLFLIGADLDKERSILEAAYNDSAGFARATNRNLLRHVNRKYEANFDPERFSHLAFHNPARMQVEVHLRSDVDQTVRIKKLDLTIDLKRYETIETQISRKFAFDALQQIGATNEVSFVQAWTDAKAWYSVSIFRF